jgi:hypothetical protein
MSVAVLWCHHPLARYLQLKTLGRIGHPPEASGVKTPSRRSQFVGTEVPTSKNHGLSSAGFGQCQERSPPFENSKPHPCKERKDGAPGLFLVTREGEYTLDTECSARVLNLVIHLVFIYTTFHYGRHNFRDQVGHFPKS